MWLWNRLVNKGKDSSKVFKPGDTTTPATSAPTSPSGSRVGSESSAGPNVDLTLYDAEAAANRERGYSDTSRPREDSLLTEIREESIETNGKAIISWINDNNFWQVTALLNNPELQKEKDDIVNYYDADTDLTPLLACANRIFELESDSKRADAVRIFEQLLDAGADPIAGNDDGVTPLMILVGAAKEEKLTQDDFIRLADKLLELAHTALDAKNAYGFTVRDYALDQNSSVDVNYVTEYLDKKAAQRTIGPSV